MTTMTRHLAMAMVMLATPALAQDGYQPAPGERTIDIGLVCFGTGKTQTLENRPDWTWNDRRGRYEDGDRLELAESHFDAALTLQIWDGGGRVRLPKSLVPPLNSGGNGGWWDLQNVVVGPDQITASYRLNGLNKPKITINRRSGRVFVTGFSNGFEGTCDPASGPEHRRF